MGELPRGAPAAVKILWLLGRTGTGAPSGGDIYDAQVISGLRKRGHRVEVHTTPPPIAKVRADVIVQDELGFRKFLSFNRKLERAGNPARRIALVHVTSARLGANTAAHESRYLASTHAAIFVSQHARRESLRLLKQRLAKTAVIPPGADRLGSLSLRERVGVRVKQDTHFLCAGHLLRNKGQLDLLSAFAPLENATLTLAGAAVDPSYTKKVRAKLQRIPQAKWRGPLSPAALVKELAKADVFINASRYESWGMAAAEAQAAGLPVVSWSKGGLWEFLTPGVDSLRATRPSTALLKRATDPALLAKLEEGARRAKIRSWKTVVREFANFLEGLPLSPTLSPRGRGRQFRR